MKRIKRMSNLRVIALGYLFMILFGTFLLCLPVATRAPGGADIPTALFTSTSASCVTGLILCDTATTWTLFGQIVILGLIQVGGLGFMTLVILFLHTARLHTGLRQRAVMAESINTDRIGGVSRMTQHIVIGSLLFELTGAALLCIRFVPRFGWAKGIFYGIFHAVSAFCNAGFDLMGNRSSFTGYADDVLINTVLMLLIIIGGIGFIVWDDILKNGLRVRRYRMHTKLVLTVTAVLVFGGAAVLWLLERDTTLAGASPGQQALLSLFGSVTARTAGFNTTDTGALTEGGRLFTVLLMFIGGSSGSTAGGVKTTSVVVIFLTLLAAVRGGHKAHCFGRSFSDGALNRAVTVFFFNLLLGLTGAVVICSVDGFALSDALFESISAISTVGMTTGVTPNLGAVSRAVIMLLMYCGRVGSVSFATAILQKRAAPPVRYPAEDITIG